MKRTYTTKDKYGEYKHTVDVSFVVTKEVCDEQYYEALLWGLAQYVPNNAVPGLAIFGSFRREGRHVQYVATVIRDETGTLIHDPVSEMWDDVAYLMAGEVEWFS